MQGQDGFPFREDMIFFRSFLSFLALCEEKEIETAEN